MAKLLNNFSAGLLMFRRAGTEIQYFLVHPGGPFFARKDAGAWTIPKGLPEINEKPEEASIREFHEETGIKPKPPYIPLGAIQQKGGKTVEAWAFEAFHKETPIIKSNTFEMEWPPRSGKVKQFPEIDKGKYFSYEEALIKINQQQIPFITKLYNYLSEQTCE